MQKFTGQFATWWQATHQATHSIQINVYVLSIYGRNKRAIQLFYIAYNHVLLL